MDKLILKQTNITEKVTTDILESLYNILSTTPPPLLSDLSGNLTLTHSYEDTIDFFTNNYPNLIINVLKGEYIRFEDKEVEKICATSWGDGIGITKEQAAAVSSIGTKFKGNTTITSFKELSKFSAIDTLPVYCFAECTNLILLDLSKIKYILGNAFQTASYGATIYLPNIISIDKNAFFSAKVFFYDIGESCVSLGYHAMANQKSVKCYIFRSTTPPEIVAEEFLYDTGCPIYVPDNSVDDYKTATNWSAYASRIKSLSSFTE